MVAEEVRGILASLGLTHMQQLVGRADLLEADTDAIKVRARCGDGARREGMRVRTGSWDEGRCNEPLPW